MNNKGQLLFEKESRFREFQIWPLAQKLDTRRWLTNFDNTDVDIAVKFADAFTYVCEQFVDMMLRASLQRLSNAWESPATQATGASTKVCFVTVEGETPSATDSGNLFARKLRDVIKIDESHILRPLEALASIASYSHVVFVDDFIGSGQQMWNTWIRQYKMPDGTSRSFNDINVGGQHTFAYCATVCSHIGAQNLGATIPSLLLMPTHQLSAADSITDPSAALWKGMDYKDGMDFLKKYSPKAGYGATDGGEDDWRGFYTQALSLGFHHGIPDATLPIFRSERAGWKPLIGK